MEVVELRQRWDEDGYVVVRGLIPGALIAELTAEADRLIGRTDLIDSRNIRCRWQNHVATGACVFETFDPVIDIGPVCGRVARHPALLELLATLYGEPARLFKDKLIFKPPGATGYGLHQDFIGWDGFPESFLTVLVPIDPSTAENGCTVVYPGIHRRGFLSPRDGKYHPLPESAVAETPEVPLELAPGDVAVFGGFVPHRSDPNRSPGWRRQLYLSYNADSEGGDRRAAHYDEFHRWLRDRYAEYGKLDVHFR